MTEPRKPHYEVQPSPARFMHVRADVGDCEFIDGADARSTLGEITARRARGEIIAPSQKFEAESNEWRDHGWRPSSTP